MNTLSSAVPRPSAHSKRRNMIAVASGKGGVGKTWFAITLAHALSRLGKRTLLFDGDLGLANVDIQLGLMAKHDLGGVLAGRLTLNQAATPFEEGGFDIIAGRSGSGRLATIPPPRLQLLGKDLALMSNAYDWVILDLGAGVEQTVRQLVHQVGACIVVTTDEPTALTDAYAFVKVVHAEKAETAIRIAVNMANSTREGERTYNTINKACEGFLKMSPPLLGVVRRDVKVPEAIRNQTSLLTRSPNCAAAEDMEAVARRLTDHPVDGDSP